MGCFSTKSVNLVESSLPLSPDAKPDKKDSFAYIPLDLTDFNETEGRPDELIGFFKSIYETCDDIIVIFNLVKARKLLLESFRRYLNIIKQALLLNAQRQKDLTEEKTEKFRKFDIQLKKFYKYLEEIRETLRVI